MRRLLLAAALLSSSAAFAVDPRPVMRTQITNSAETETANVIAGRVQVDSTVTSLADLATTTHVVKQGEATITTRNQTDISGTTYTVPAGKTFRIFTFGASMDQQTPVYVRLQKQTGGSGAFATLFRITLKQAGQDEGNFQQTYPQGAKVGTAGDVFKITYEVALIKGTVWAGFTGLEY